MTVSDPVTDPFVTIGLIFMYVTWCYFYNPICGGTGVQP